MTSLPYVVPFGAVIVLLAVHPFLPLSPLAEQAVWILVMTAVLAWVARPALGFPDPQLGRVAVAGRRGLRDLDRSRSDLPRLPRPLVVYESRDRFGRRQLCPNPAAGTGPY